MTEPQPQANADIPPPREKKSLPKWTAFALIGGSAVALGLPLFFLRRRQRSMLEHALKNTQAPPRRTGSPTTARYAPTQAPKPAPAPTVSQSGTVKESSDADLSLPGIGEMFGAMSKMSYSTAMLGAKAFGIATCIVGVSAFITVVTVKTVMGIETAHEFGERMRQALWSTFPGLTSVIHRPSETEEERISASVIHPAEIGAWKREESEERLRQAFEKGGLPAWGEAAMKEVEIEAHIEREGRKRLGP
ncbi:hypothetical protein AX16_003316 [Volvariella volvacea WC 439]|nr:hypothetical protein AX16_003316 [Volvariella volvacea WC 439]